METRQFDYPARKTLLLTGASGVVGQALLEKIGGYTVICLVRRTPVTGPNIVSLCGDVTRPRLGLDQATFEALARRVDGIVHAAAITNFAQPADEIHRANVDGVRHVLELAARAQAPLYHISTAFVHPSVQGYGDQGALAYQLSKRAAEQLVQRSGVPATIVRPSIIVGDSRSGAIASFQGLHLIASLLLRGLLPIIPMPPLARLDVVPQDLVADVIAGLIERGDTGGAWWVTCGEQAPTVGEMAGLFAAQAQRVAGRPIAMPRLVNRAVFERLMRSVPARGQARLLRRIADQALELSMYCVEQPLPSSLLELGRRHGRPLLPPIETTVQCNLDYWVSVTADRGNRFGAPEGAGAILDHRHSTQGSITERGAERCIA